MNYQELLAKNAKKMRPSGIRKFFDLVLEMPECISLGVGEPDFQTPWVIREEAIHSLEWGLTKYTANAGLKELRQEILQYQKRKYNLDYQLENIFVSVGGSEGIDVAIRALVEPEDEVILPEPCFVSYEPLVTLTGGIPISIETKEENEFRLKARDLKKKISPKTKLLVLSYPNNPTGAILEKKDLQELADVLKDTNITILSDEIYSELVYGEEGFHSIAQIPGMKERTLIINGFSKTFSMTGWRLGYCLGPKDLIQTMTKIHQSSIMAAPTISQYAAITALKNCDKQVEQMRHQYDLRRQYLVRKLNRMGLKTFEPKGAFYVFPNISILGLTSEEFCERLLEEEHVAIIPGTAFGQSGEGFARISYAYSLEYLQEAMNRIEHFLEVHKRGSS